MTVETKERQQGAAEWLPEFTPASEIVRYAAAAKPASAAEGDESEGYYGVPMLKQPKWRWEIALYFFCERRLRRVLPHGISGRPLRER
jgi:hypothetical protein